jgi:hypothetical protein
MTRRLIDPAALARCHDREGCAARVAEDCNGRNEVAHHRKLKKHLGPDTDANLLNVCHPCHLEVHRHPKDCYLNGLLVPSWADPEEWPVTR